MIQWKHPNTFVMEHTVNQDEIDFLNHVNNKVYLAWIEEVSWKHSLAVGVNEDTHKQEGKVMVIKEHLLKYHAGCFLGDRLIIGTWVGEMIGTRKRKRHFEIYREKDGRMVFSGHTIWACMDLETYRGCDIPEPFITPYQ